MMKEFKGGDRVAIYDEGRRKTGTVRKPYPTLIDVDIDVCLGALSRTGSYHPKQLRHLRMKQKPVAREWWCVCRHDDGHFYENYRYEVNAKFNARPGDTIIHVREVLPSTTAEKGKA